VGTERRNQAETPVDDGGGDQDSDLVPGNDKEALVLTHSQAALIRLVHAQMHIITNTCSHKCAQLRVDMHALLLVLGDCRTSGDQVNDCERQQQ
jgi:nitrite reductase/ring-hydroxylating ferredoxin subunit